MYFPNLKLKAFLFLNMIVAYIKRFVIKKKEKNMFSYTH